MADLRAEIVQKLLENCNSVKVKRIFLYLADCLEHPWVSRIDMTKISLGQGKRAVVKGGVFNKKYKLSVPREIKEECAF
jgi:hypothetical protein